MKSFGFPKMHKEKHEVRDFLPDFFSSFIDYDAEFYLERGYGSGMGISEEEYHAKNPRIRFVSNTECYKKDIVVVLRCPEVFEMDRMKEGAVLVSMLHYPTRASRVRYLKKRNIFGVSMDDLRNDLFERIVVNYRGTSGNGVNIAFMELEKALRRYNAVEQRSVKVSVIGMGMVGLMATKYAARFGNQENAEAFKSMGVESAMVNILSRDITANRSMMQDILADTDILIDASNRQDPSRYIVNNDLLGNLKQHAVILDLSADPYMEDIDPMQVKAIEGIPTGTLDQYVFSPDDPAYNMIPSAVRTHNRRTVVSCNAWPGINPENCMHRYGIQVTPIMQRLITHEVKAFHGASDDFFLRAIYRATLDYFEKEKNQ